MRGVSHQPAQTLSVVSTVAPGASGDAVLKTERRMALKPLSADMADGSSPVEEALDLVHMLAERSASGLAADAASTEGESSSFALERAISQAELSERLRVALVKAAARNADSMEALRVAVCAFTVALRDDGITPEAVLISLKEAIQKETLIPLWETSSWSGPSLQETITTWCISDYFAGSDCIE